MRGPLRCAEPYGQISSGGDPTASLRIAERPPHPRPLRGLDLSPRGGERWGVLVIASEAKQSSGGTVLDCFVATARRRRA
jgi:hypothetical protein